MAKKKSETNLVGRRLDAIDTLIDPPRDPVANSLDAIAAELDRIYIALRDLVELGLILRQR